MNSGVEVAIITGAASALGGLIGASSALLGELIRGRSESRRRKEDRIHEDEAKREVEILGAMSAARIASIEFVQFATEHFQPGVTSMPNVRMLHESYLKVVTANEALWAIVRTRTARNAIESVRHILADIFDHLLNSPSAQGDISALAETALRQLRVVSLVVLPTEHGIDDLEYQRSLENLVKDVGKVIGPRSRADP